MSDIEGSSFYQERLSSDTMTDRMRLNSMVLEHADQIFFMGTGNKRSEVYHNGMLGLGMGEQWESGSKWGIHNVYLETLFLYGVPLLALLLTMLISVIRTQYRLMVSMNLFFFFPLSYVVMYTVMNLTNSFQLYTELGILLGIILGCSAAYARILSRPENNTRIGIA